MVAPCRFPTPMRPAATNDMCFHWAMEPNSPLSPNFTNRYAQRFCNGSAELARSSAAMSTEAGRHPLEGPLWLGGLWALTTTKGSRRSGDSDRRGVVGVVADSRLKVEWRIAGPRPARPSGQALLQQKGILRGQAQGIGRGGGAQAEGRWEGTRDG